MAQAAEDKSGHVQRFVVGEAVRAFYDMNDHPNGYRFVRLLDAGMPQETRPSGSPTVGLSCGWIPATVAEDYNGPADGPEGVLVRLHGRFEDAYREEPEPAQDMHWRVHPSLIRQGRPQPVIELSLVVVRWSKYHQQREGSRSHNNLNEGLLLDVLQGPKEAFGSEGCYEVFSAFVSSAEEIAALPQSQLAKALRGQRKAALYFVWPTQRPAADRHGCVAEPALHALMQGLEAADVRTCWPHPSPLYRELAGKRWVSRLGNLAKELKVPPTVAVSKSQCQGGVASVATAAIEELQRIRREVHGGEPLPAETYSGVAKLGYAWMGEAVLPFIGQAGLERALAKLLDGALLEAECLVQERVPDVKFEMRIFCCRDRARGPEAYLKQVLRMKLHAPRHQALDSSFSLTSHLSMTSQEAADLVFNGNTAVLEAVEAEVQLLADRWLRWFREEGPEGGPPHVCRLDFLVSASQAAGRQFEVHTCELTECGGATCGLNVSTRTAAVLNECVVHPQLPPPSGFPRPLPPFELLEVAPSRFSSAVGGAWTDRSQGSQGPSRGNSRSSQSGPSRGSYGGGGGGRSRREGGGGGNSRDELQERGRGRSAVAMAAVLAILFAQGRAVTSLRNRMPRLPVAFLALVVAVIAAIARRSWQPKAASRQRNALTGQ
ncbi:unnamed protein product [Polarella glacialis]|uniref:Uncharacterized protein n=1 Tax=Polarella glacialis TaxID=89957 RepID=A0A813DU01_POLGL|nr:unnamed protein product [Polarella glacialis]CAE8710525.1 unnamed protein product [Polarella glacialis]